MLHPSIHGLQTVVPFLRIVRNEAVLNMLHRLSVFFPKTDSIRQPAFSHRPRAKSETVRMPVVSMKFGRDAEGGKTLQPPLHGAP